MAYPPIVIVDKNDEPIGEASLAEIHGKGLLHRVVHIFVEDEAGKLLLQKRGPTVATHPNYWDFSAAGHVDSGDSYLEAATKELSEELGLRNFKLEELGNFFKSYDFGERKVNHFSNLYKVTVPKGVTLTIEPSEVAEVKWFEPIELKQFINKHPDEVTDYLIDGLNKFYF